MCQGEFCQGSCSLCAVEIQDKFEWGEWGPCLYVTTDVTLVAAEATGFLALQAHKSTQHNVSGCLSRWRKMPSESGISFLSSWIARNKDLLAQNPINQPGIPMWIHLWECTEASWNSCFQMRLILCDFIRSNLFPMRAFTSVNRSHIGKCSTYLFPSPTNHRYYWPHLLHRVTVLESENSSFQGNLL